MYYKCIKCDGVFPLSDDARRVLNVVTCPFCGHISVECELKFKQNHRTTIDIKKN